MLRELTSSHSLSVTCQHFIALLYLTELRTRV